MKVLCTNKRCVYVGRPREISRPRIDEGIYLKLRMGDLLCACGFEMMEVSTAADHYADHELEVERAAMERNHREDTENGLALEELSEWVELLREVMRYRLGDGQTQSILDDVEQRFTAQTLLT